VATEGIHVTATNKDNTMDAKKFGCRIRTREMEKDKEIMAHGIK
jgi:hypothetical protein